MATSSEISKQPLLELCERALKGIEKEWETRVAAYADNRYNSLWQRFLRYVDKGDTYSEFEARGRLWVGMLTKTLSGPPEIFNGSWPVERSDHLIKEIRNSCIYSDTGLVRVTADDLAVLLEWAGRVKS